MTPFRLFPDSLGLIGDASDQPPPERYVQDDTELVTRDMLILAGGSALAIGVELLALFARDRRLIPLLAIDNHFAEREAHRVSLPDGRPIEIASRDFFALGYGHSRDEVRRIPHLRDRYEGPKGLLRGISVRDSDPGFGGHAWRAVSLLDYDLSSSALRRRLAQLIHQTQPMTLAAKDSWDLDRRPSLSASPSNARIWIIFSGVGSCGAAGGLLLPYLVQREAHRLGRSVAIYGVCTGPEIYESVHDHVDENYAATLADIEHFSRHGIDWLLGDGTLLRTATAGYRRVFLFDDASALERVDLLESSGADRYEALAGLRQGFFRYVATCLFLAMASTALDDLEAVAANRGNQPWSTMTGVLGDANRRDIAGLLPLHLAAERLSALCRSFEGPSV